MSKRAYILSVVIASAVGTFFIFGRAGQVDVVVPSHAPGTTMDGAKSAHHQGLGGKIGAAVSESIDYTRTTIDKTVEGPELITRVSLFGEQLGDPWLVYSKNIELAKSGDADAQYEVSRILFQCKAVTSQELIDKHSADGLFTPETASELQEQLDWCRELNDNIGSALISQSLDWMNAAAEQGHVLARGRRITLAPFNYTASEARQAMTDVLLSGEPEMYWMMVSYYANYRDDDVVNYEAWMALSCRQIQACEIDEYRDSPPLRPNEQKQVDETIAKIEAALEDGHLNSIDF